MMEGLVGCPRTPTSLPGPLDAGTAPSFLMPGSKAAGDGRFESVMASLKLAIPDRHRAVVVLSLAHIHALGRVWLWPHASLGPCQTMHWLPGASITAQRAQNQAGVRHFDPISRKIGHVSRVFLVHSGATRRFHW